MKQQHISQTPAQGRVCQQETQQTLTQIGDRVEEAATGQTVAHLAERHHVNAVASRGGVPLAFRMLVPSEVRMRRNTPSVDNEQWDERVGRV